MYLAIIPLMIFFLWLENRFHKVTSKQYFFRLILAMFGYLFDSLFESAQLITFNGLTEEGALGFAPLWLLAMWAWFALTLSACYQWLNYKPLIAISFAAVFGPLAYWGASKISSVLIINPLYFTTISSLFWGSLFAFIFLLEGVKQTFVLYPADK